MKVFKILIPTLAILTASNLAFSDVVILRDGQRLEGRVEQIAGDPNSVTVITATGQMVINRNRISEIIEEPDYVDWTRIGDALMERRNFSSAISRYQQALEANPEHQPALDGIAKAQQAIEDADKERIRSQEDQLANQIESVPALIENEQFAEAENILKRADQDGISETLRLRSRQLMRDLYLAWGFSREDRLDRRGAEEYYTRVMEIDPNNREARERLLRVWKDDPTKREFVLQAYKAKLQEEPDNLEYVKTVADLQYAMNNFRDAIPQLEQLAAIPRFAAQGYNDRLRNAYY